MSNSILLTGRPLDDPSTDPSTALQITGELDGFTPGEAYEGRLQLVNYIGDCSAVFLDGTDAPAGLLLSVDNDTHEIVLTWAVPDNEYTTIIPNGDFETTGGWTWNSGNGWTHQFGYGNDSDSSARFADFKGESHMVHSLKVPVSPGTAIHIGVDVQQGSSSSGNVIAGPLLQWYDSAGNALEPDLGNAITTGAHGQWHRSDMVKVAPAAAQFVSPGFYAVRFRQNRELHVDNLSWDYTFQDGGLDADAEYPLVIQATDSANRKAVWRGTLSQRYLTYTTQPYAAVTVDAIEPGWNPTGIRRVVPPATSYVEGATVSFAPGAWQRTGSAGPAETTIAPEGMAIAMQPVSWDRRTLLLTTSVAAEGMQVALTPVSITRKQSLVLANYATEGVALTFTPNGITRT